MARHDKRTKIRCGAGHNVLFSGLHYLTQRAVVIAREISCSLGSGQLAGDLSSVNGRERVRQASGDL